MTDHDSSLLSWQVSGGCAPYTVRITARYADQRSPYFALDRSYARLPIADREIVPEPPARSASTPVPRDGYLWYGYTVVYTVTVRDASGGSRTVTSSQEVTEKVVRFTPTPAIAPTRATTFVIP